MTKEYFNRNIEILHKRSIKFHFSLPESYVDYNTPAPKPEDLKSVLDYSI